MEKNPLRNIQPPDANEDHASLEAYLAARKKGSPSLAAIWGGLMEEEIRHSITISPEGKVVGRMSSAINQALNDTLTSYVPEVSGIRVPVLSIYTILDSANFLSPEYMTVEQQEQVIEFIDVLRPPHQRECIEHFRRQVPQARIVVIPRGHHYCFIKHEELVFEEMRKFLLE
jgi:hypothetical protein